jgi:DNA-binding SARP family transcriptional activator
VITLHTLGETYLSDELGRPLGGAATQRRTLALLSVLAVSGDAGLSRDKIVGLLWPRAEEERARHSLTQGMYAARRALGVNDLFDASAGVIRLDFERIACDVRAFESLLERGDLEDAVAAYTGPFLDGFFLSGSPEFEQWSAAQRDRLQGLLVQALDRLATRAEEMDEHGRAVEWRRRLVGLLPLDSAHVVKLMQAMARAGDRAGAIQQARVHATLLDQEMELEPDPVVETLAERLRTGTSWLDDGVMESSVPAPGQAGRAEPAEDDDAPPPPAAPVLEIPAAVPAVARARGDRAATPWHTGVVSRPMSEVSIPIWVRWAILSAVVLTLISAGVLIGRSRRAATPVVERLAVPQRVVVAPFRVTGAAAARADMRDGMVVLR